MGEGWEGVTLPARKKHPTASAVPQQNDRAIAQRRSRNWARLTRAWRSIARSPPGGAFRAGDRSDERARPSGGWDHPGAAGNDATPRSDPRSSPRAVAKADRSRPSMRRSPRRPASPAPSSRPAMWGFRGLRPHSGQSVGSDMTETGRGSHLETDAMCCAGSTVRGRSDRSRRHRDRVARRAGRAPARSTRAPLGCCRP
jgi:hypothetical protein